jgi:hypothetical protein
LKVTIAILAALGLLMAGCGTAASSQHPASPTPSPVPAITGPPFTVPTKTFHNTQLGIAFRYPASWQMTPSNYRSTFKTGGIASVDVGSPRGAGRQGAVHLLVSSARIYQHKPPRPYMDAPLSMASGFLEAKAKPTDIGFVRIDRLRLVSAVTSEGAMLPASSKDAWRVQVLFSRPAEEPPWATTVQIEVGCPQSGWQAEQPLLDAILSSMRFSPPTGGWPGS